MGTSAKVMVDPTGVPMCLTPEKQQSAGGPAMTADRVDIMWQLVSTTKGMLCFLSERRIDMAVSCESLDERGDCALLLGHLTRTKRRSRGFDWSK